MAGQQVGGRYELGRELASGPHDRVFEGVDLQTGRPISVKLLVARSAADVPALQSLQQHGHFLTALEHPNVVRVFDILFDGRICSVVMELVHGGTLKSILASNRAHPGWLGLVARQVAAALAYAHERDVLHLDLKPADIMVLPDGTIKVRDFGVGNVVHGGTTIETLQAMGGDAPLYLAPEQIEGLDVDGRTDIFALGAILFHVATGSAPFSGRDPLAVAYKILHSAPTPPRQLNPDLEDQWQSLIMTALEKDPRRRYQSATELQQKIPAGSALLPGSTVSLRAASPPVSAVEPPATESVQTHAADDFAAALLEEGRIKERRGDLAGALHDYTSAANAAGPARREELQREIDRVSERLRGAAVPRERPAWILAAATGLLLLTVGALAYLVLHRTQTRSAAQVHPSPVPSLTTHTPVPITAALQPGNRLYGPASGELPNQVAGMGYRSAGVRLRDFVADIVFHNPYDQSKAGWDYGLLFRDTGPDQEYRLVVSSGQDYFLYLRYRRHNRPVEIPVGNGTVPHLDVSTGGSNYLRLIVRGQKGYLLVNGKDVATLDVARKMLAGDVTAVSAVLTGDGLNGTVTHYDLFTVWTVGQ